MSAPRSVIGTGGVSPSAPPAPILARMRTLTTLALAAAAAVLAGRARRRRAAARSARLPDPAARQRLEPAGGRPAAGGGLRAADPLDRARRRTCIPTSATAGATASPINVVGAATPAHAGPLRLRRRVGPGRLPDPGPAAHRAGRRPAHPDVDRDACRLYEIFAARRGAGGRWSAGSGAVFDLRSNALRPAGWTSADAAGLPILPGTRALRRGGRRRHRPRAALHRPAHAPRLHPPGAPRGLRLLGPRAAADGPAGAAEGVGARCRASAPRHAPWRSSRSSATG